MLRIYLIQNLYRFLDEETAAAIIYSRFFSDFCRVKSGDDVPDGDTIGRFRNILVQHNHQERLFAQVLLLLGEKGLILKKGAIVDSTIIASQSSTKTRRKSAIPKRTPSRKAQLGISDTKPMSAWLQLSEVSASLPHRGHLPALPQIASSRFCAPSNRCLHKQIIL